MLHPPSVMQSEKRHPVAVQIAADPSSDQNEARAPVAAGRQETSLNTCRPLARAVHRHVPCARSADSQLSDLCEAHVRTPDL